MLCSFSDLHGPTLHGIHRHFQEICLILGAYTCSLMGHPTIKTIGFLKVLFLRFRNFSGLKSNYKFVQETRIPLLLQNSHTLTVKLSNFGHKKNKTLYSAQLKDISQERLKSEVKWTNDFQNYDIVLEEAYQMAHRCTIDMKLRNFQYKYLMRIVPNNKYLFKYKLAPTVLCDFCAMQEETNAHLFWECSYVQEYWSKIQKFLKDNNLEIELTYYRISFGILDKNNIKTSMINFIILIAKYWLLE